MLHLTTYISFLFLPGPGPFKAVIDMFGSSGGLIDFRAALFASRGFVAYSLPYFRYEDLPETMANLDLDYFEVRSGLVLWSVECFHTGNCFFELQ